MNTTLVIMAAGMGSRYGGNKQIDGVGPNNEILMEYSIYDAMRAGFDRVVFIIKPDMKDLMDGICGNYLRNRTTRGGAPMEVGYAFQDFSSIPAYYTIPQERTKPFGTIHALLCAKDVVDGPFCVINADDYYGVDAFATIHNALLTLPAQGHATMVGYELAKTASLHGTVSRGVCTTEHGKLCAVEETLKIQLDADGTLTDLETGRNLACDTVVSMNFWGFQPSIFQTMDRYFEYFLREVAGDNVKAECLLPAMVDQEVLSGKLAVSVLSSADRWFGMTYAQDRESVVAQLQALHANGTYPPSLKG